SRPRWGSLWPAPPRFCPPPRRRPRTARGTRIWWAVRPAASVARTTRSASACRLGKAAMRAALLLAVLLGAGCRSAMREPSDAAHEEANPAQRVGPPGARARAAAAAVPEARGSWVEAGPRNVGGRVTALGVDPHDPARIWVGTAAGGVFLTEDEGATFRPVFDGQTALAIGSLA